MYLLLSIYVRKNKPKNYERAKGSKKKQGRYCYLRQEGFTNL